MNDSSEIANNISEHPCGITSILPSIGMSCRGRAEAFARRLQTKLKTLGSQNDESPSTEESTILNGLENSWIHADENEHIVQAIQPLRLNHHQNNTNNNNNINKDDADDISDDAYYDFDCEIESPGSPADECEYTRLVETMSNTPNELENEYANTNNISSTINKTTIKLSSQNNTNGIYNENFYNKNDINKTLNDVEKKLENHAKDLLLNEENWCKNDKNQIENGIETEIETEIENETEIKNQNQNEQNMNNKNNEISKKIFINIENENHQLESLNDEKINLSNHNCFNDKIYPTNNTNIDKEFPIELNTPSIQIESQLKENNIKSNNQISVENSNQNIINLIADNNKINNVNNFPIDKCIVDDTNKENKKNIINNSSDKNDACDNNTTTTDEDDDEDLRPQRVRRCSSLKTGKTPPGTPGRKKIVRFADVLGLDLADVKTFLDEIPNVPKSAYQDLEILELEQQQQSPMQLCPRTDRMLMPMFQQPGGLPTFLDGVRDKQVNLESATIIDNINFTIAGVARVRNLDFHKSVHIRYTYDHWRTFFDIPARYVLNSCDGFSDRFEFMLCCSKLEIGQRLEFALRFQCKGQQFWDNNYGSNYCFQCLPATNLSSISSRYSRIPSHHNNDSSVLSPLNTSDAWCISFY